MSYENQNSSWDKLERKQHKNNKKKSKYYNNDDIDLSIIPESYIGNEELFEELSDELEDLYG